MTWNLYRWRGIVVSVVVGVLGAGGYDIASSQQPLPAAANVQRLATAEEAIRAARQAADKRLLPYALTNASIVYDQLRRFDDAVIAAKEALELFEKQGDKTNSALSLENLSVFYRKKGQLAQYVVNARAGAKAWQATGDGKNAARVLADLAAVQNQVGQYTQAQRTVGFALATPDATPATRKLAEEVMRSIEETSTGPGGIVWNVWFEDPNAPFQPVAPLRLDTAYRAVIDIATVSYRSDAQSDRLSQAVKTALQSGWTAGRGGTKRLFVSTIDVTAIRALKLEQSVVVFGRSEPEAVDAARKSGGSSRPLVDRVAGKLHDSCPDSTPTAADLPGFVLSRICVDVRTGATPGATTLYLILWVGDRPVEQISVPVCVSTGAAGECSSFDAASSIFSVLGVKPFEAAAGGPTPGAQMQLYGFADGHVGGIFRHSGMQPGAMEPFTFTSSLAEFLDHLEQTSLKTWEKSPPERRLDAGRSIYDVIFPENTSPRAREAFGAYIHRIRTSANPDEGLRTLVAQTIFSAPFFLPLNLMVPPVEPLDHLGRQVNIVTSLPVAVRNTVAAGGCVSRWILVVPSETADGDTELQEALKRFLALRTTWEEQTDNTNLLVLTLDEFAKLVNKQDTRVNLADGRPTGIVILSHHTTNVLSVGPRLLDSDGLRGLHLFRGPTFAVLNGCSTGSPGAVAFVRRLSELGVGSIIATSTGVSPQLAGEFVKCFNDTLAKGSADGVTVRQAYEQTKSCLWQAYGSQTLQYALLGDGNIRLCPIGRAQ